MKASNLLLSFGIVFLTTPPMAVICYIIQNLYNLFKLSHISSEIRFSNSKIL